MILSRFRSIEEVAASVDVGGLSKCIVLFGVGNVRSGH